MLFRGLALWLAFMAIESLAGAAREAWLAPAVGSVRARQVGAVAGILIILVLAVASAPWFCGGRPPPTRRLLALGGLWVVLTLGFEVLVGRAMLGHWPWARMAEDFDPRRSGLMAFGLLALAVAPLVSARVRFGR